MKQFPLSLIPLNFTRRSYGRPSLGEARGNRKIAMMKGIWDSLPENAVAFFKSKQNPYAITIYRKISEFELRIEPPFNARPFILRWANDPNHVPRSRCIDEFVLGQDTYFSLAFFKRAMKNHYRQRSLERAKEMSEPPPTRN